MNLRSFVYTLIAAAVITNCADDQARSELADTNQKLSSMQTEIDRMSAKVDNRKSLEIMHLIEGLQNQINELNDKLSNLKNTQDKYQELVTKQEKVATQSAEQVVEPTPKHNNAEKLKTAFKHIKKHEFDTAINILKSVISTSQNKSELSQAQYYLVVAYAANSDYQNSIKSANIFVAAHPNDVNVANALYTKYVSQIALNINRAAQKTKSRILSDYPNSNAAKKLTSLDADE